MWVDGGLATTLQAQGLPPHHPVEPWVLAHPDRVRAAHAAFVDAGAEIVLTATFRAYPDVAPAWAETVDRAIALAREAAAGRAEVWLCVGPPGPGQAPHEHALVARGLARGVDGVLLETRGDPAAAVDAVERLRPLVGVPLVASLVPDADGGVGGGEAPGPWLRRLRAAGADGAGFNCGTGPADVLAAARRVEPDGLWVEVAGGDEAATVRALAELRSIATWCGGCCGVSPALLARAVAHARH